MFRSSLSASNRKSVGKSLSDEAWLVAGAAASWVWAAAGPHAVNATTTKMDCSTDRAERPDLRLVGGGEQARASKITPRESAAKKRQPHRCARSGPKNKNCYKTM